MVTVAGPTTWIVVMARCTACGKPGPIVEKQPEALVRVTFICNGRRCAFEQRQTL